MKKQKKTYKTLLLFFLVCSLIVFAAGHASADTLTLAPNYEFSGATAPAGTAPWITATFNDVTAASGFDVRLTMSANNLVNLEFIDDWLFNLDPTLNPTLLTFDFVSGSAGAANDEYTGTNAFQADGDGKFDISFDYPPPPGNFGSKFTSGELAIYDIGYDGAATLNASSFNYFSVEGGGNGSYLTAAHVQGIGASGNDSGWVGTTVVPEPISSTLFLIGGVTLGFRCFRKKTS